MKYTCTFHRYREEGWLDGLGAALESADSEFKSGPDHQLH